MRKVITNYDAEGDILYINFHDPPLEADDTHRRGDILFRVKNGELIGATILDYTHYEDVIKLVYEKMFQTSTPSKTEGT